MKLRLSAFDMSTMPPDATCMLIGKRRTGKSTLLRDIMYHMRDKLEFGVAMCGSDDTAEDMAKFIPESCIYDNFSAAALNVLLKYQGKCVQEHNAKKVFLIMDDTMYDKKTLKSQDIRQVFMNGRHKKVFFLCAVQYLMDISPDLRCNIDFLFVLKENILSNREKLWKYFFGMFADFKDFSVTMNSCTDGFGCMVLNNTVRSNKIEDCVFWYQADPSPPSFRVCSPGIWLLDETFRRGSGAEDGAGHAALRALAPDDGGVEEEEEEEDGARTTIGVRERLAAMKQERDSEESIGALAAMRATGAVGGILTVEKKRAKK
jgi:hypothetical protein